VAFTVKTTLSQDLPPAPVEAERSTKRLLQALTSLGRLSTTVGYRVTAGGRIDIVGSVLVELLGVTAFCTLLLTLVGHVLPCMHFAPTIPIIKVKDSPTSNLLV
jgi:hypothetical protein